MLVTSKNYGEQVIDTGISVYTVTVFSRPTQPAIPLWVGAITIDDGIGHLREETASSA